MAKIPLLLASLLLLFTLAYPQVSGSPIFMASSTYDGGFSKSFSVYKYVGESGAEEYLTEVVLSYRYSGPNQTLADFTIEDSVPASVISQPSQMIFITLPASINQTSSDSISFSWNVESISKGEEKEFVYRFYRAVTPQMVSKFGQPKIVSGEKEQAPPPKPIDTAASASDTNLIGSPLSYMCIGAASMFILLLVLSLIFGNKPQKKQ